jgi:hypothetical protein
METANASQGRLRGRTDEALVLTGKDKWYVRAAKLGRLYVPYDENGHPIEERVGRHVTAIAEIINSWNWEHPETPLEFDNIPSYEDLLSKGLGAYLLPVQ